MMEKLSSILQTLKPIYWPGLFLFCFSAGSSHSTTGKKKKKTNQSQTWSHWESPPRRICSCSSSRKVWPPLAWNRWWQLGLLSRWSPRSDPHSEAGLQDTETGGGTLTYVCQTIESLFSPIRPELAWAESWVGCGNLNNRKKRVMWWVDTYSFVKPLSKRCLIKRCHRVHYTIYERGIFLFCLLV